MFVVSYHEVNKQSRLAIKCCLHQTKIEVKMHEVGASPTMTLKVNTKQETCSLLESNHPK